MELMQDLREAKKETNVGLTEFYLVYKEGEDTVYCFVEAEEDELYYGSVFRIISQKRDFKFFQCNGKDGVLAIYKLLHDKQKYRNAKKGFFIDRDFDKKNRNRHIYQTPYYSIENFYTSVDFLKNVLLYVFKMRPYSDDYSLCLRVFVDLQRSFHDTLLNLNSILACYSKIRIKISKPLPRLKIDSVFKLPDDLVASDLQSINLQSYKFSDLDRLFSLNRLVSKSHYKQKIKKFKRSNKGRRFRGKFEIFFMIKFLHRLKHIIEDPRKTFCSKAYTTAVQFRKDDFITVTNSFAEVPNCLKKYVRRLVT